MLYHGRYWMLKTFEKSYWNLNWIYPSIVLHALIGGYFSWEGNSSRKLYTVDVGPRWEYYDWQVDTSQIFSLSQLAVIIFRILLENC